VLFGVAFFTVPGVGPLFVAAPRVGRIVSTLEGAGVVGGFIVVGGTLASIGIPKDSLVRYE